MEEKYRHHFHAWSYVHVDKCIHFYRVGQLNKRSSKLVSDANPLPVLLTGEFFLKNLLEKRKAEATLAE